MSTAVNRFAASALRGQGTKITLDSTETGTKLPNITVGQKATTGSTSKVGYVYSVDYYGNSFIVTPRNPDLRFDSTASGYLSVGEVITLV
ncbi:MAG TPA: hypothetical protein VIM07_00810 [Chitinophagaceae bacterium]